MSKDLEYAQMFIDQSGKAIPLVKILVKHQVYSGKRTDDLIRFLIDSNYDLDLVIPRLTKIASIEHLKQVESIWAVEDFIAIKYSTKNGSFVLLYEARTGFRPTIPFFKKVPLEQCFAPNFYGGDKLFILYTKLYNQTPHWHLYIHDRSFKFEEGRDYESLETLSHGIHSFSDLLPLYGSLDAYLRDVGEGKINAGHWWHPYVEDKAIPLWQIPFILDKGKIRWRVFVVPTQNEKVDIYVQRLPLE